MTHRHLINARDKGYATTICRPEDWKVENKNYHTHDDNRVSCGNCKKIRGTN